MLTAGSVSGMKPAALDPGDNIAIGVVGIVFTNAHEVAPIEAPGVHGCERIKRLLDHVLGAAFHALVSKERQHQIGTASHGHVAQIGRLAPAFWVGQDPLVVNLVDAAEGGDRLLEQPGLGLQAAPQ